MKQSVFHNLAFVPRSTRNEELNRVYAHEKKKKISACNADFHSSQEFLFTLAFLFV